MLHALENMLLGGSLFFVLVMVWLGAQHLVRKGNHLPPDCDVLDETGHPCGQCARKDGCAAGHEEMGRK